MKDKRIQTKRQTPSGFKIFQAKTRQRKQRASTSTDADVLDTDVPNMNVKRALTVLLVLHVVVISAIFIGTNYTKESTLENKTADKSAAAAELDTTHLNVGLKKEFVLVGETYKSFADRFQVEEAELRAVNNNVQIHAGRYLYVPNRKVAAQLADEPAQHDAVSESVSDRPAITDDELALEEAAGEPQLIKLPSDRPQTDIPRAIPVSEDGGNSHVVQQGESVWRISQKYKVSQDALLKLNGLDDPRKLRIGMTLKIPN